MATILIWLICRVFQYNYIYFQGLLNDFQSQNRTAYKAAHVYFTEGESSLKILSFNHNFLFDFFFLFQPFPTGSLKWWKSRRGRKVSNPLSKSIFPLFHMRVRFGVLFVNFLYFWWRRVFFTNNFNRWPAIFPADTKILRCVCPSTWAPTTSKGFWGKRKNLTNTRRMLLHGGFLF